MAPVTFKSMQRRFAPVPHSGHRGYFPVFLENRFKYRKASIKLLSSQLQSGIFAGATHVLDGDPFSLLDPIALE